MIHIRGILWLITNVQMLWAFSIWLESVAILPQLFMLQRTGEAETITTHYLFALGAYRALYIPNWIWRYFSEGGYWDPIPVLAGSYYPSALPTETLFSPRSWHGGIWVRMKTCAKLRQVSSRRSFTLTSSGSTTPECYKAKSSTSRYRTPSGVIALPLGNRTGQ